MVLAGVLRIFGNPYAKLGPLEFERLDPIVADHFSLAMLVALFLGVRRFCFDLVTRQVLRQTLVATLSLLATHMFGDHLLRLFDARFVDRLGQAVDRVGRVVAKLEQQLVRIVQITLATPGKRSLDKQFDLEPKLFLLLFECFDLALKVIDRMGLGFDQTGLFMDRGSLFIDHGSLFFDQHLARGQIAWDRFRFCVGRLSHACQDSKVFKSRNTNCGSCREKPTFHRKTFSRGASVPLSSLHANQRHAAKQHGQLRCVDDKPLVGRLLDLERSLLQHAVIDPKPAAVPMKDLHPITPPIDEQIEAPIQRIAAELAPDDAREAVDPLAHVGRAGVPVDRCTGR